MVTKTAKVVDFSIFREIITNFGDPLEFAREAISNSLDAHARTIRITITSGSDPVGESETIIEIRDDGEGMDERGLEQFFNLGDTTKFEEKHKSRQQQAAHNLVDIIGEKGLGAKIFLNSRRVEVYTSKSDGGKSWHAVCANPFAHLHAGAPPVYELSETTGHTTAEKGTTIKFTATTRMI